MKEIVCEECNKTICLVDDNMNKGSIANVVIKKYNGIAKMPILWGITDGFHFFCCKECWNKWFKANCKDNEEGRKIIENIKNEAPKIIENCHNLIKKLKS